MRLASICLVTLPWLAAACGDVPQGPVDGPPTPVDGSTPDTRPPPDGPDVDAGPNCETDDFDGTTLAMHWTLVAGEMPTYEVNNSRLLISDSPFAATPSNPNESWLNDLDTDKGNQIGWRQQIGGADFDVSAEIAWSSSTPELTLAGVAVSDAQGKIAAYAGIRDGTAMGAGSPSGQIRVATGDDLGWVGTRVENGTARLRLVRTDNDLRILVDDAEVLTGRVDALIDYVTVFYVRYHNATAMYPFGTAEIQKVTVCR